MINSKHYEFLGLRFDSITIEDAIREIENRIESTHTAPGYMLTPTAELIVMAHRDSTIREIYLKADLLTADGYVVYYAAKLFGLNLPCPVSASRVMFEYLPVANLKSRRIYLLGATQEVVSKVAQKIRNDYPEVNIAGFHNGYFDFDNDYDVVNDIKNSRPDVLFIAISSPLKEKFIARNINKLSVPMMIGVGGAFDIIAGKTKLAPLFISKCGLEWLWRLIQEPRRLAKRYIITNTIFIWLLIKEFFKKLNFLNN